jgi:hypothetical protein
MGKKSRRQESAAVVFEGEVPVVGMREPCPCGSGKRYKACHGKDDLSAASSRPFEGFVSECDIVAMRELVPSATAPLELTRDPSRLVTMATVLPMAWPALVRDDGQILLGLQVNTGTGDASRDVASALLSAIATEPGNGVAPSRDFSSPYRLQDLIDPAKKLDVTVHENFDFWIERDDVTDEVRASLERASTHAYPTARLTSVEAGYWTRMGEKEHLRWVTSFEEESLLDALARLHAAKADDLGENTKFVGMFRAQGLVTPVWDLPIGFGAEGCEVPIVAFEKRLLEALADSSPLTDDQRRARSTLTTKQVTLR